MSWADFWEQLDGRVWYLAREAGVIEKRTYTPEQAATTKEWIRQRATVAGWVGESAA